MKFDWTAGLDTNSRFYLEKLYKIEENTDVSCARSVLLHIPVSWEMPAHVIHARGMCKHKHCVNRITFARSFSTCHPKLRRFKGTICLFKTLQSGPRARDIYRRVPQRRFAPYRTTVRSVFQVKKCTANTEQNSRITYEEILPLYLFAVFFAQHIVFRNICDIKKKS